VLGCALGGCGAVDTYRSIGGLDRNDPDPAVTPYTVNLAAGETADYPNLATVPPPPVVTTSLAERDQMAKSLIADRVSAERALMASSTPPRVAPPGEPDKAVAPAAATTPVATATATTPLVPASSGPTPSGPAPSTTPPVPAAETPGPSSPVAAATPGSSAPGAPPTPAASNSGLLGKGKPGQAAQRKPGEPPEPGSLEARLEIPELRSLPGPEHPQPAPPPPRLGGAPVPAPVSSLPTVAAAGLPAPPPEIPVIPPPPPPPVVAAKAETKRPPVGVTVATFEFPAGSDRLSPDDRSRFSQVAAAFREKPGTVRVVAYAPPTGPGIEQLNSYRSALNRAQLVAVALKDAGIPANKIQSEAAPTTGGESGGRVDVQLLP
jgi:outer membrane protein OmpA-like peptidoglycan-associated protein